MIDGCWNPDKHQMWPVRSPFTVAIQRTMAWCRDFHSEREAVRFQCSGCLDRIVAEDY